MKMLIFYSVYQNIHIACTDKNLKISKCLILQSNCVYKKQGNYLTVSCYKTNPDDS